MRLFTNLQLYPFPESFHKGKPLLSTAIVKLFQLISIWTTSQLEGTHISPISTQGHILLRKSCGTKGSDGERRCFAKPKSFQIVDDGSDNDCGKLRRMWDRARARAQSEECAQNLKNVLKHCSVLIPPDFRFPRYGGFEKCIMKILCTNNIQIFWIISLIYAIAISCSSYFLEFWEALQRLMLEKNWLMLSECIAMLRLSHLPALCSDLNIRDLNSY